MTVTENPDLERLVREARDEDAAIGEARRVRAATPARP